MGKEGVKDAARVQLPYWEYLWGETLTNPDNVQLDIPSSARVFVISSEDGKCYYDIGQRFATPSSDGYIPVDGSVIVGPLTGATIASGIWVYAPSAILHVSYYRER